MSADDILNGVPEAKKEAAREVLGFIRGKTVDAAQMLANWSFTVSAYKVCEGEVPVKLDSVRFAFTVRYPHPSGRTTSDGRPMWLFTHPGGEDYGDIREAQP